MFQPRRQLALGAVLGLLAAVQATAESTPQWKFQVGDEHHFRLTHQLDASQDLPGGGSRLIQPVRGYLATLVNGVVTRRDDEDTGARPGRLVRSP